MPQSKPCAEEGYEDRKPNNEVVEVPLFGRERPLEELEVKDAWQGEGNRGTRQRAENRDEFVQGIAQRKAKYDGKENQERP